MWSEKRFLRRSVLSRLNGSSEFGDHYDAACTYAVALLPAHGHESVDPHDRIDALTASAVEELCRAAHVGGSTALAASWDLILSEDLDLVGLRGEPAFRRFETEWLPAADRVAVRPRQIVRLKASRSSVELCSRSARCLARIWHARVVLEGPTDVSQAFAWLGDEIASWDLARELVAHHRHWQTRLKVINEMQRFAARNGAGPFRARHPLYMDRPLEGDAIEVDRDAGNEIHFSDLRLSTLAEVLGPRGDPLPGFTAWRLHLSALDRAGKPVEADERRRLANNRSAAWSSLHRIFDAHHPAAIGTDKRPELTFRKVIETEFDEIRESLTQAPPPARPGRFARLPSDLPASPWVEDHPPFVVSVPGPASRC